MHACRVCMYAMHASCCASLWDHLGVTLGSLWGHFGIILGSFWGHFGIILGSFWDHFGIILGYKKMGRWYFLFGGRNWSGAGGIFYPVVFSNSVQPVTFSLCASGHFEKLCKSDVVCADHFLV